MAWDQTKFNQYMAIVRTCNAQYERYKRSRIHTFTGLLKMKRFQQTPAHLQSIQAEWNKVPADAQRLYGPAWQFVQTELNLQAAPSVRPPMGVRPLPGMPGGPGPGKPLPGMTGGLGAVAAQRARARDVRVQQQAIVVNENVSQLLDGTTYAWRVKFSILRTHGGKQGQSLVVSVPLVAYAGNSPQHRVAINVNLTGGIPAEHTGAPLSDGVKRNWASRILERWGGGVFVVKDASGDDLDTFDIDFKIDWVENPSQAAQVVFAVKTTGNAPPDGTVNTMYWGVDDGGTKGAAIAHEFGHLIGNPDEYGSCTFNGKNNSRDKTSVMDNETAGQAKARHFFMVGAKAASGLGFDPTKCVVRFNAVDHRVDRNHPW